MNSERAWLTALVDADNFYVSCERIFAPNLGKRPVVVLSNNDGCVVARSQEVKDLGVRMGVPFFQIRELAERHGFKVFSSNYELYGDISARVMQILGRFSDRLEPYSIDEAFLELPAAGAEAACRQIAVTCREWLGIPVKVGLAPTKTLAKVAAHLVKLEKPASRCRRLVSAEEVAAGLEKIGLEDIWGIGRQSAARLQRHGVSTPAALAAMPDAVVRERFGVVLARTALELRGTGCISLETAPAPRRNICCSRSFGRRVGEYEALLESVVARATEVAAKLRRHKLRAGAVSVFIMAGGFDPSGPHYANSACLPLPLATADTLPLARAATAVLAKIFRPGLMYRKSGVLANDLISENLDQDDLFVGRDPRDAALSKAMDAINARHGDHAIALGATALRNRQWAMTRRCQSPCRTTRWGDILRITG